MAICKDCLYFKRCVVLGVELNIQRDKEAEKNCRHFKNTADVVEVVRCEKCIHLKHTKNHIPYCELWESKSGGKYTYCICEVLYDGFCSYGERKE